MGRGLQGTYIASYFRFVEIRRDAMTTIADCDKTSVGSVDLIFIFHYYYHYGLFIHRHLKQGQIDLRIKEMRNKN